MKGNSIFSKCALKHHLKMLRSVLQTATKKTCYKVFLVQHDKNEFLLSRLIKEETLLF